jgi:hypothetical protein
MPRYITVRIRLDIDVPDGIPLAVELELNQVIGVPGYTGRVVDMHTPCEPPPLLVAYTVIDPESGERAEPRDYPTYAEAEERRWVLQDEEEDLVLRVVGVDADGELHELED